MSPTSVNLFIQKKIINSCFHISEFFSMFCIRINIIFKAVFASQHTEKVLKYPARHSLLTVHTPSRLYARRWARSPHPESPGHSEAHWVLCVLWL